jgi:hypothetical protein
VNGWIMTRPGKLADADRASLDAILAASAELAAVAANVRAFAVIMNERRGRKLLEPWMTAALDTGEPALGSFVTGLCADQTRSPPGSASPGAPAPSKATSTASRCSNDKCTDARTPTCSAAASSSPTNQPRKGYGNCARARILTPSATSENGPPAWSC